MAFKTTTKGAWLIVQGQSMDGVAREGPVPFPTLVPPLAGMDTRLALRPVTMSLTIFMAVQRDA